jgi:hypothetical protein
MSLAFLCAPAFLYLVFLWHRRTRPVREQLAGAAAGGAALMALLVLLAIMNHPGPWTERTQIAWVGIEPAEEGPLVMGGNLLDAAPGWPLRHANPKVSFTPAGGDRLVVHCGGGGGFVYDDHHRLLYGTPLENAVQVGAYKLMVRNYRMAVPWTHAKHVIDLHAATWHIAIYDGEGRSLLAGDEGVVQASDETAINLLPALDRTVRRMRAHSDPTAGPLVEWASHIQLLLTPGGKAYYVADEGNLEPAVGNVTMPAGSELTIHWPRLRLKMRLESDHGTARLVFLPPFRQSSPLPPGEFAHPDRARLTIEPSPSPGDVAFLLPIALLHQRHYETEMERGLFTEPAEPEKIAAPLPEAARPSYEDFAGVTSSLDAQIDRYHFYLDTIRDVPAVWWWGRDGSGLPLAAPLALAWISYLFCVAAVCDRRFALEARTRLSLLGVSLVVWVVLCLRLALAYRYAANPGTLDELGRRGVLVALAALAVAPGFTLLFACRMVVARGTESAAALKKAWLWSLPAFVVLLCLPGMVRRIWPLLDGTVGGVGYGAILPLFAVWLLLSLSLWLKSRRLRRGSWKPTIPAEDRLASMRRWVEQRWQAGWPKKNIVLGVVVSGVVCGLAILSNFVRPLNGMGKEVFAPLYQLTAIAIVLAAKPYSLRGERHVTFWRRWGLRATLILVPFIALPFCFNDIGGVYAGLSLLIPFGCVLIFRQARRPVWFLAPLASLFVVAFLVLWYFPGQVPGQRSYARLELWKHTSQWVQSHVLWEQAYNPGSGWDRTMGWVETHLLGEESWSPGGTSRAQQLADTDAHIWANRRMVAIGRFWGAGYGQVRAAKAGIPLQTLEADSTYAFYIAGEHGALGGMCLLLFASLPLAFAWWRHRQSRRPTWLSDLLYIVTAGFYIETLCQIVMNALPLIPITGRSLPLLSVHSMSDILRWMALFACAALLMVTDRESAMEGSDDEPAPQPWHVLILAVVVALGALPWLALIEPPPAVYDRDQRIRDQIDATRKGMEYDPRSRTIAFRNPQTEEMEEYNEIHQEMEHFNGLPNAEKAPLGNGAARTACGTLEGVGTPEGYGDWMEAQMKCDAPARTAHPALFRVYAPDDFADEEGLLENTDRGYTIAANPAFDAAVSLDTELKPGTLKTIAWRDGEGASWLLQGMGGQVRVAAVAAPGQTQARVTLRIVGRRLIPDSDNAAGNTRFQLACGSVAAPPPPKSRGKQKGRRKPVAANQKLPWMMDVVADTDSVKILPGDVRLEYQRGGSGWYRSLREPIVVTDDTRLRTSDGVCRLPEHPTFTLSRSSAGALIGEAWVEGEWVPAYNKTAGIPWLEELAWAVHSKHPPEFSRLTLDPTLEAAAQQFVEEHGRELQAKLLAETPGSLPPRIALSITTAPSGEVEALGGWPRNSSTDEWEPVADAEGQHWIDVRPPVRWLATEAPAGIRSRYLGERNFDRMIVGSASKPLWAAAALGVNARLGHLDVTGNKVEDSLFGAKIPGKAWTGTASGLTNFTDYLAKSNNSYQVVLNFLALAPPGSGSDPVQVETDPSGRALQTTDRAVAFDNMLWQRFPNLSAYGFRYETPNRLDDVQTSELAATMQRYFPLEAVDGTLRLHGISFWSGNENDNRALPAGTSAEEDPWSPYVYMSPATTDLELDTIRTPRTYISDLLGGGTNLWSNVDLPSAMYTALFGTRLVPHIAMLDKAATSTRDAPPAEVTAQIQAGLARMIDVGTGRDYLPAPTKKFAEETHCGCTFYAKTGTLHQDTDRPDVPQEDMARLVLVIVPHDPRPGGARRTLLLSLMVEHGGREAGMESNNAVKWMADFLTENTAALEQAMR